jgi:hypothetical protein
MVPFAARGGGHASVVPAVWHATTGSTQQPPSIRPNATGRLSIGSLLGIRGGPALLPAAAAGHGTGVFQAFGYLGLFLSTILILRVIIATAREGIG